jgi:hypothetical protein
MMTGLLSACSSGLIIYIISMSQQKLSTTYHRIMTCMSCFDIISSIFFALGTIMMPSDNIYKLAGPMLGNKVTCQAQGWLTTFGIAGCTSLNACLAWYFVSSIAFKVDAEKIKKRIEPVMYSYAILVALVVPSFYVSKDFINPNPNDSFCTISPYPESCDEEKWYDWNECTWRDGVIDDYFASVVLAIVMLLFHFILIVAGMSIILWTVSRNRQEINALRDICSNHGHGKDLDDDSDERERIGTKNAADMRDLKRTRVVIFQALMYIAAFFLTWVFNFFSEVFNIANYSLDACNSFFFPLQGLWNLLIFLYDKTYLIQQSRKGVSIYQAVKEILSSPSDAPEFVVSNISHVMITTESVIERDQPNVDDIYENPYDVSVIELSMIGSEYDGISNLRDNMSTNGMSHGVSLSGVVSSNSAINSSERSIARAEILNIRQRVQRIQKRGGKSTPVQNQVEPSNDEDDDSLLSSSSSSSLPSIFDYSHANDNESGAD